MAWCVLCLSFHQATLKPCHRLPSTMEMWSARERLLQT